MVAWFASQLGELGDAFVAADSILRDLAPNQAQATALSLAAWQTWSLTLLGRWDEVSAAGERAARMWEESGRISAGFAIHGQIAALESAWRGRTTAPQPRDVGLLGIAEHSRRAISFRRLTLSWGADPKRWSGP